MRLSMVFALLLFGAGCGLPNHAERKYLAKIYGSSPNIRVPQSQFDTAWSRAKWFVTTYSSRPVQVMNDSLITTDTTKPTDFERLIFFTPFYVHREDYEVTAHYIPAGMLIRAFCWRDEHNSEILVDYIKTGSLPYPELISK
jgi:hypothetical protein